LLFIALAGGAIFFAGYLRGQAPPEEAPDEPAAHAEQAAEPEYVPFADLDELGHELDGEESLHRKASTSPARERTEDLLAAPVWVAALAWGEEGQAHLERAFQASEAQDHSHFREEGRAAKALFEKALDSTADFYERVAGDYGEREPQVSKIRRTRKGWRERQVAPHKLVGS
jgi:hypothetical protein